MAYNSLVARALAARLVQPDPTTCGSAVLVVSRMINDASYAASLVETDPAGETVAARFRQHTLEMHRTTSALKDSGGGWQVPWPKALGTQPWALARELANRCGEPGRSYSTRPIRPGARTSEFSRVAALAGSGHAVALYVGNTWSPRHVVLVLPVDDPPEGAVMIYDPASGNRYAIDAGAFSSGSLEVAGWHVPWVVVAPT